MSTVILAEKPSQALAYAQAFNQSDKKDGYFEIKDPLFTDETFITFGFGISTLLTGCGLYSENLVCTILIKSALGISFKSSISYNST